MSNFKIKLFLAFILFSFILINSCDIDNVPTALRPEYSQVNMQELLFNNFSFSDGLMIANYGSYIQTDDTIYQLGLSAEFIDYNKFSYPNYEYTKANVGDIRIAGVKLTYDDTTMNYHKQVLFSGKSDSAKLFFNVSSQWSVDSSYYQGFTKFERNIYLPEPINLECNFQNNDTISMNTDLVFKWKPDSNIKTKMAVIVTNFNSDTSYSRAMNILRWHKILEDNGSITIPGDVYLQHMYHGANIVVQFGRAYEEMIANGSKKITFRIFNSTSYVFVLR